MSAGALQPLAVVAGHRVCVMVIAAAAQPSLVPFVRAAAGVHMGYLSDPVLFRTSEKIAQCANVYILLLFCHTASHGRGGCSEWSWSMLALWSCQKSEGVLKGWVQGTVQVLCSSGCANLGTPLVILLQSNSCASGSMSSW